MADEPKPPQAPPASSEDAPDSPRAAPLPRTDDKSPSPGFESTDAGNLPTPETTASSPTPESQAALTGKAPSGSSASGTTAQSDDEKAAKIAEARAKAAAAKQVAGDKQAAGDKTPAPGAGATAAPGAPKAPVKKKDEGPKPTDAAGHALVEKLREQFDGAVLEASEFLGQLSIGIDRERILEVCESLKRDGATPFDFLSDLTCVHLPTRAEAPFEVVYNLYSISANERVRLKVGTDESDGVETVSGVWPAANWMEREVFDLFGVPFRNHPDLRRILLPPDWQGYPLRKDYPLEFIENEWTARHLPEFTTVHHEQLEQRRAYGLEQLSELDERRARDFFRQGKEVMSKDK